MVCAVAFMANHDKINKFLLAAPLICSMVNFYLVP